MSADPFTTATQLAVLLAGRTPVWSTEAVLGSGSPPDEADDGVYLQRAVRTLVHVSLRQNVAYRSVRLQIPTPVLSGTYTVTINGTAVTYNAAGAPNVAAILDGIAAAINADGTVGPLVTATSKAIDPSVTHNAVDVLGDAEADFSIDFAHSGAAVVSALADYCSATMRLWWFCDARAGSTPPSLWAWSGETWTLDRRGLLERYDSAGLARLHVQVNERAGHPDDGTIVTYAQPVISIGPCLSEAE